MKIYTIGFTKKTAEGFFNLLKENRIDFLIDLRLNNSSQLSGFSKGKDLRYFLREICDIEYSHIPDLAPTKNILKDYKNKDISWDQYENQFKAILTNRGVWDSILSKFNYDECSVCLLCSESTADNCHRRLVAEYICDNLKKVNLEIIHL